MGIVKSEYVHARTYATREEAALDLFGCIEVVYSRVRMHSVLGYLSPAKFEEAIWPKEESHPGGVKGVNGRRILRNVATPPNAEGPYRRGKTSSVQLWGFTAEMEGNSSRRGPLPQFRQMQKIPSAFFCLTVDHNSGSIKNIILNPFCA